MFRRIRQTQFWCVALCVLPFSLCQGCVGFVPMRAPTHTTGEWADGKLALGFIQAGKTGREEVTQKLSWTDTGLKDDNLFMGRWASSSWGVYSFVCICGFGGGAWFDDWTRHWGTHNVLIAFDDNGLVKQYRVFPDSELVKRLAVWLAESPSHSLDLSKPMEIRAPLHGPKDKYFDGTLVLGSDSLEFREDESSGMHNFKIAPKQIRELALTSLAHTHWSKDSLYPPYMNGTIHFTEKTPAGSEVTIRVDVPTVMVLVKYLSQTRSN